MQVPRVKFVESGWRLAGGFLQRICAARRWRRLTTHDWTELDVRWGARISESPRSRNSDGSAEPDLENCYLD